MQYKLGKTVAILLIGAKYTITGHDLDICGLLRHFRCGKSVFWLKNAFLNGITKNAMKRYDSQRISRVEGLHSVLCGSLSTFLLRFASEDKRDILN
jgi:hypothetical protein